MTTVYLTMQDFAGDGITTVHEFSFAGGYLSRDHVRAYTQDAAGTITEITITPDMWEDDFRLDLGVAAPVGGLTRIFRDTPRDMPLVNFEAGARVTSKNLDLVTMQAIFVAAEAMDNAGTSAVADLLLVAGASLAEAQAAVVSSEAARDAAAASAVVAADAAAEPGVAAVLANLTAIQNAEANAAAAASSASAASTAAGQADTYRGLALTYANNALGVFSMASSASSAASGAATAAADSASAAAASAASVNPDNFVLKDGSSTITGTLGVAAASANGHAVRRDQIAGLARALFNGTVSQSGGVATGAVIQQGSNANGSYTRWADGTQMCRTRKTTSSSGGLTWTFPIAFSAGPDATATNRSFAFNSPVVFGETPTSLQYAAYDGAGLVVADISIVAWGRWF